MVDCQVQVLRHLRQRDPSLPVPSVFATVAGGDVGVVARGDTTFSTLLIDYLVGGHLRAQQATAATLRNMGAMLARIDSALEGFFHPGLAQALAWDVRRLPELAGSIEFLEPEGLRTAVGEILRTLQLSLPALDGLRIQAIHGDYHAGNLLLDRAGVTVTGVVDFGDMILAPLVLEVAVAMAELLTEGIAPLDELAEILQGYTAVRKLQAAEVECLYDLVTARHAVTLLVHAWRLRHDQVGATAVAPAAARAERSLRLLTAAGRSALAGTWHEAAGTLPPSTRLRRRRVQLMGAGAELFYAEPLHIVRGEDVWLYDAAGRRYLDVYNNVAHVGHSHPAVVEAICQQTALLATHTRYLHEAVLDYAEQLTSRLPPHLDTCIFVNSGSEANDVAWRIARSATGNRGAMVMAHAYHGITEAISALTPGAGTPRDPHVVTLQRPPASLRAADGATAEALRAAADDAELALATLRERGFAPAAFYLDSALTSTGIFDPPAAWAAEIAARARGAGALIVADEVQYGLGRSGSHYWGFSRRGLAPDIVTLGKPVGNGFPLGVVIASRALIEDFQAECGFFSTFGGNAVAAAAGIAVVKVLDREQLMANAQATGAILRARLATIAARHDCLGGVRGAGLLLGLEVIGPDGSAAKSLARQIVDALAARHGILTGIEGPQGNVLKLRPPMTFRPQHADLVAEAIDSAATAAITR